MKRTFLSVILYLVELNVKTMVKLKDVTLWDAIPSNTKCIDEHTRAKLGYAWNYLIK
jgi:hypothetical protein